MYRSLRSAFIGWIGGPMTVQPLLIPTIEDAHGGSCDWKSLFIAKIN